MPTHELPRPRAIDTAIDSNEILSVWIVNKEELATVFPPNLYGEDVWKWGRLLANIARYAANAHADMHGIPEAEALEAIRTNFDEDMRNGPKPGDITSGGVVTGRRS